MMETVDLEEGTTDSVGGLTPSTLDADDYYDVPVHDQLPSVEEYKTNMTGIISVRGLTPSTLDADDYDDVPVHDQLPSVEEYKTNMTGIISPIVDDQGGDDDGEYVHDQLPSVEEVKAAAAPVTQQKSCCMVFFQGLGIFLLVAALLVAIIVPPVVMKKEPRHQSRWFEVVDYLETQGIATQQALADPKSPQYYAAAWIADYDGYYMPIPTSKTDKGLNRFVERYALAVLYYATNGPGWEYNVNFLTPVDVCNWFTDFKTTAGGYMRLGVSLCGEVEDAAVEGGSYLVLSVDLSLLGLHGQLPDEIKHLHRLKSFYATFNPRLRGSITSGMLQLGYLEDLELQYCMLTGTIPDWLGDISSLTNLGLGNNLLTGEVPVKLFELQKLSLLGLDDNTLEGDLESFGRLTNLEHLYIEDNNFKGALTKDSIDNWQRMKELDLSTNFFESNLPDNLFSMPVLEVLDLHGNNFKGAMPSIADDNNRLLFLSLYDNWLDEAIPASISKLSRLEHLDLSRNNFVLPYPNTMGQLTRLRYLFTGSNAFMDHDIPNFVTRLTKLRELSMKDNNLIGSIPTTIASLTSLQLLDLHQNKLNGTIPEELGLCNGLDHVLLNRNQLTGTLPKSFAIMHDLDLLLIDGNEINGNADVICMDDTVNPVYFVSDCKTPNAEIECSCCQLCCDDTNTTCNNLDWNANLDPIWEYSFTRIMYQFGQELLP